MARTKRKSIHYVNNKEFSQAVVVYCTELAEAKKTEIKLAIVPDYIANCFLKPLRIITLKRLLAQVTLMRLLTSHRSLGMRF